MNENKQSAISTQPSATVADLREEYQGKPYTPIVEAICFYDSEGFSEEANNAAAALAAKEAEIKALKEEREKLRHAIVQASIDITNLVNSTPTNIETVVYRSMVIETMLQMNKDFAAALGSPQP